MRYSKKTMAVMTVMTFAVVLGLLVGYSPCESDAATATEGTTEIPVQRVSLDNYDLSLLVGESDTLRATVYPDNATNRDVSWSSSNRNVATVSSSGAVQAVGAGTATITATADGKFVTCKVTVEAITITLSENDLIIAPGASATVDVRVSPQRLQSSYSVTSSSSIISAINYSSECRVSSTGAAKAVLTFEVRNVKVTCNVESLGGDCTIYDDSKYAEFDIDEKDGVKLAGSYEYSKGLVTLTVSESAVKGGVISTAATQYMNKCIRLIENVASWAPLMVDIDFGSSETMTISSDSMARIASAGASMKASSDSSSIAISSKGVGDLSGKSWSFSAKEVSNTSGIEGATMYSLSMKSGSTTVTSLSGTVTVSLPYDLDDGKSAFGVKVYSVGTGGSVKELSASYNSINGTVALSSGYTTQIAIAYDYEDGGSGETSSMSYVVTAVIILLSAMALFFSFRFLRM